MKIMAYYVSLSLVLLCFYNITPSNAFNGDFSVDIIHRDSPRSPLYSSIETQFQRNVNAVHRSIHRLNNFNQPFDSKDTVEATITSYGGEYLMSYSIGTPPFKLFGIIDTGSDIVWLQCQPCRTCYKQTTPIFNSLNSKTYKTIPCATTRCQSVPGTSCSSNAGKICEYTVSYADGSYSRGDLSMETLTLKSTNGSPISFPRIMIGCGHNNNVSFEGKSSGIVGLGGGGLSLISQLRSSIGGKFSYCLGPVVSQSNSTSKLSFGDGAIVSGVGTVSTPIVSKDPSIFYYLTLQAFSVGNNRIEFSNFSSRFSGKGNIIIDSGTTLTILPNDVYSRLESAVAGAIKLKRVQDPGRVLSLCYNIAFDQLHAPVIIAHFSGADVKLNAINTFFEVDDGITCLAFVSSQKNVIFGNLAQQNFLIGYDLEKKVVSFKPRDCTNYYVY